MPWAKKACGIKPESLQHLKQTRSTKGRMTRKIGKHKQRVSLAAAFCFLLLMLTAASIAPTLCAAEDSGSERKVCLFFDDGWQNQYGVAFPILKEFGFKASFSVITDRIGADRGTFASRMNVDELRELQAYGMVIACHTKTHPHMLNLTSSQLHEEIVDSKNALAQMGFNVKTFVYPFGEWNDTIVDYVKDAGYVCAREAKPKAFNLNDSDPNARYSICSWQITNQSLAAFKQILSNATEENVVVLTYHFLSDNASKETYITVQNFREQMTHLKEGNFSVVLLSELFAVDEEPVGLLPYFVTAILGAGLATVFASRYIWRRKNRKLVNHDYSKGSHRLSSVFEKDKQHLMRYG
jgi:peptidoglycan/xylan/chitin deacetylase (PgdA/CDA1 family)